MSICFDKRKTGESTPINMSYPDFPPLPKEEQERLLAMDASRRKTPEDIKNDRIQILLKKRQEHGTLSPVDKKELERLGEPRKCVKWGKVEIKRYKPEPKSKGSNSTQREARKVDNAMRNFLKIVVLSTIAGALGGGAAGFIAGHFFSPITAPIGAVVGGIAGFAVGMVAAITKAKISAL